MPGREKAVCLESGSYNIILLPRTHMIAIAFEVLLSRFWRLHIHLSGKGRAADAAGMPSL